jgi:hypothetical protein
MNAPYAFPDALSAEGREAVSAVFAGIEILPMSCQLFQCDEYRTIPSNRKLSDDWIYIPKTGSRRCTVAGRTRDIGPGG